MVSSWSLSDDAAYLKWKLGFGPVPESTTGYMRYLRWNFHRLREGDSDNKMKHMKCMEFVKNEIADRVQQNTKLAPYLAEEVDRSSEAPIKIVIKDNFDGSGYCVGQLVRAEWHPLSALGQEYVRLELLSHSKSQ